MESVKDLEEALATLGAVLAERRLRYELVAIGGGVLLLIGFLDRATKDLDVVALVGSEAEKCIPADPFPEELARAVRDVGRALGLDEKWLNPGPSSLLDFGLPEGFLERVETRRYGGLTVRLAGRADQICFKLYAAVDQGPRSKHLSDLRRLNPTRQELLDAARWSRTHDPSDGYRRDLMGLLRHLGVDDAEAEL